MLYKYRRACRSLHAVRCSISIPAAVLARPRAFVTCWLQCGTVLRLKPPARTGGGQSLCPRLRAPRGSFIASRWSKKATSGDAAPLRPRGSEAERAEPAGTNTLSLPAVWDRHGGVAATWVAAEVTIIFGKYRNLWCILNPLDNLKWMFLRTLAAKISCFSVLLNHSSVHRRDGARVPSAAEGRAVCAEKGTGSSAFP